MISLLKIISPGGIIDVRDAGGLEKLRKVREPSSDEFRAGYITKYDGGLRLNRAAYALLKSVSESDAGALPVTVYLYKNCGGVDTLDDTAFINLRDANYDADNCTVDIKITAGNQYEPLDRNKNDELNLFDLCAHTQTVTFVAPISPLPNVSNGVRLYDAIYAVIARAYGQAYIVSDFFGWNPTNPSYIIGHSDRLHDCVLFQKSDVIRYDKVTYSPATILPISPDDLLTWLCQLLNLKYDVDAGGNFRIEHYSYWETTAVGLDLTAPAYDKNTARSAHWEYKAEELYRREIFTAPETDITHTDFVGQPIYYLNAATLQDGVGNKQLSTGFIVDIRALLNRNAADTNQDFNGVVLAATYTDPATLDRTFQVMPPVLYAGTGLLNNPLAWAQVHTAFFRHGRQFKQGYLNGLPVTFNSAKRIKQQKNVIIPGCCGFVYDRYKRIRTIIGDGVLLRESYSYQDETLTLDVAYESADNVLAVPGAGADTYNTAYNTVLNTLVTVGAATLIANDVNAVSVLAETKATIRGGTVVISSNGYFVYTPPLNFLGIDAFAYFCLNAAGATNSARAQIVVSPAQLYVRASRRLYIDGTGAYSGPAYPGPGPYATPVYHVVYALSFFRDAAGLLPLDVTGMDARIRWNVERADFPPPGAHNTPPILSGTTANLRGNEIQIVDRHREFVYSPAAPNPPGKYQMLYFNILPYTSGGIPYTVVGPATV